MSEPQDQAKEAAQAARRAEADRLNAASAAVVDLARELNVDLTSVTASNGAQIIVEDVCRASGLPEDHQAYLTYVDAARAARLGLKAADFKGTGPRGLIMGSDIRKVTRERAAEQARTALGALVVGSPTGTGGSRSVEQTSAFNGLTVRVDPWARNPLLDDARQAEPLMYKAALSEGPAPTLFKSGGDLPAFLASGGDPQILLKLPWIARHAAAKADGGQLFNMVEDLSGADGVDAALIGPDNMATSYVDEVANNDYRQRFQNWLYAPGLDPSQYTPARKTAMETSWDMAYDSIFPEEARKKREAVAAAAEKEAKARYDEERKRIRNEVHSIDARRGQIV